MNRPTSFAVRALAPLAALAALLGVTAARADDKAGVKAPAAKAPAAKAAAEVRDHRLVSHGDWQFKGTGTQLLSGTGYTLYNVTDKESLKYKKREFGINMGWDKGQQLNNIKVKTQAGGAVKY